jgi:hypothetical protein
MSRFLKDGAEVILFFLLTFALYLLFMVTVPILRETHGLLVMADLPEYTRDGLVSGLLFGSAGVCVLLGVLLLNWVPLFSTGVLANLFATTFIFMWIDAIFTLSMLNKSWRYMVSLGLGSVFIYLFFFVLDFLRLPKEENPGPPVWKAQIVSYWLWGWMGFYLGLSFFLAFHPAMDAGSRFPLAMAAMVICFLNYLLSLFLKKSQGKEVERFSRWGRLFFTLWSLGLLVLWIGFQWFV